jgi:predicted TPR repeat methyltransferase/Flp pilus assembly protein TadD
MARPPAASSTLIPTGGRATYEEALRFNELGRVREAERACREVLRQTPSHVGALRLLANIAYRSGRGDEAAKLLTLATRAAPHDAVVLGELGLVLRELGRFKEAEVACRKALELDSRYSPAHDTLAELFRRSGRLREARDCLQSALRLAPHSIPTRVSLGDILVDQGEVQAAVDLYREAIAASPSPAPIYVRLGIALRALGDTAGALEAGRQAVTLAPGVPEAHYHLAETLMVSNQPSEAIGSAQQAMRLRVPFPAASVLHSAALAAMGDFEEAIKGLAKGLAPRADPGQSLAILGNRLLDLGYPDRALECFRRKLEGDPEDTMARHFVAALSGQNPDRPSDEYVRQVFDSCADSFDRQLVEELSYSVPRELAAAALAASTRTPPWDVLELGCGTGLVGVEFAKHAKSLVGVDLSPKMIERAGARRIYTHLICGDLSVALDGERCYDVIIAAEVFVYVGKLDSIMPALHRALRPGGLLVFTAESAEGHSAVTAGYWLGMSGRYAHDINYLNELAVRHGFATLQLQRTRLRLESRRPVMGWLAVWCAATAP